MRAGGASYAFFPARLVCLPLLTYLFFSLSSIADDDGHE